MKLLLRNICITKWRYPVYRVVASLTSGGPAKNGAVPWMDGFSWPRSATLPLHSEGPTSVALTRIRGCAGNSLEMKNAVCVYLPRPDENQRPRYVGGAIDPRVFTHFFRPSILRSSLSVYPSLLQSFFHNAIEQ